MDNLEVWMVKITGKVECLAIQDVLITMLSLFALTGTNAAVGKLLSSDKPKEDSRLMCSLLEKIYKILIIQMIQQVWFAHLLN